MEKEEKKEGKLPLLLQAGKGGERGRKESKRHPSHA